MPKPAVSLKHLRCFLAVAETASFTVAATRLFMTQSALTATIQQFEDAVGVKMFDRTTRRVVLTHAALHFKPEAEKAVFTFDTAVSDLKALAQAEQGHIRIGAAASVIHEFLVHAIAQFRESYPHITISLRDPSTQQVEQLVAEGKVDFAFDGKHQGLDGLEYTPLVADRYGVVCHKDSAMAQDHRPLCWADLTPAQYVAFSADTGIGQFLRQRAGHWPVFAGQHDEVATTASLFAVLSMGNRYSVLPAMALKGCSFSDLVFRELHEPPLSREIYLISRRLRALSPGAQRLLDILLTHIRSCALSPGVSLLKAPPSIC